MQKNEVLDECKLTKVIGTPRNKINDTLIIDFQSLLHDVEFSLTTKRNVVQFTSLLFDPLGLISPLIIKLYILFQDMQRSMGKR